MDWEHIEEETFIGKNLALPTDTLIHYEQCTFKTCAFGSANLSGFQFTECTFEDCDLSNANLMDTSLMDIVFINCKMLGLNFDVCNPLLLQLKFDHCNLSYSSFKNLKLPLTLFLKSNLTEVEFTQTNLSKSIFDNCELWNTVFDNTILEGVRIKECLGLNIDLQNNYVSGMSISPNCVEDLLSQYQISIINE